jgi:hypothetical protein
MVFMTNNMDWSPATVCDLYRRRWDIEVFFKQVKQCLKLSNFLGHSANAVRWQVYSALLVYVLLRLHGASQPVGAQLHPAVCGGAAPRCGNAWTCWHCSNPMGQHRGDSRSSERAGGVVARF